MTKIVKYVGLVEEGSGNGRTRVGGLAKITRSNRAAKRLLNKFGISPESVEVGDPDGMVC